jgi:hypothetical protein
LVSNICPHVYSFRWKCGQLAKDGAPIEDVPHFTAVQNDFFKMLGKYKYAVTDNSPGWLNYTVAKYFEMPYMGAVLIATPPSDEECKLIGFEHGKNCLFTKDPHDVTRIIDGSYTRCDAHESIAKAGAELMARYHTASCRLDYIATLASEDTLTLRDSVNIFTEVKEIWHGKVP